MLGTRNHAEIEEVVPHRVIIGVLDTGVVEGPDAFLSDLRRRGDAAQVDAVRNADHMDALELLRFWNRVDAGEVGEVVKTIVEEKRDMRTNEEVRASKEYMDAFARYLISENDNECRSLLTTQVSGSVPVPVIVDDIIRTAWEKDDILSRVKKTNIKGNLKVAFELSATGAWVHTEGTTAPTEESLALGIVEMIPRNIKKWIRVSDEAIAMGGETLVRYIYDELTHQIVKKLADLIVNDIKSASSASSSAAGVANFTAAPAVTKSVSAFLLTRSSDLRFKCNGCSFGYGYRKGLLSTF